MLKTETSAWQIHAQMDEWLHLEVMLLRGEMMSRRTEISQLHLLLRTVCLITAPVERFAVWRSTFCSQTRRFDSSQWTLSIWWSRLATATAEFWHLRNRAEAFDLEFGLTGDHPSTLVECPLEPSNLQQILPWGVACSAVSYSCTAKYTWKWGQGSGISVPKHMLSWQFCDMRPFRPLSV